MKDRRVLAQYFRDLGFTTGAEVGVAGGYYSEVLCQTIPNLKLYCIDYWAPYKGYDDFARWKTYFVMEKTARKRLAPYPCTFIKKKSMDAVKDFADESLDFVFIDGNHAYEYVREDIREWTKKVRKGGIVAGHDYYKTPHGNVGVIRAVNEFVKAGGYKLKVTRWARHVPKDDRQPSWYFFKL